MLRTTDFIWLESVIEKLEVKHGVDPEEVEEVFANREVLRLTTLACLYRQRP